MTKYLFLFFCFLTTFFHSNIESSTLTSSYSVTTVWATAYQVTVKLTNPSNQPTTSWTASFTLPQNNVLSTHVTGGTFSEAGQNVTVKNLSSNDVIAANGNVSFTMIIDMPQGGSTTISNLTASANGSTPPPPPVTLAAPTLTLMSSSANDYTLSWNAVANATTYNLQTDISANFTNPVVVYQGNAISFNVTNQPAGTYYYRVQAANSTTTSPFSNIVTVTVNNVTPPPPSGTIQYSAWYIDWTSWFTGPPFVIPTNVNMLNIFVGEFTTDASGNPTLGGFGTFTNAQMQTFVNYLNEQNPPIKAKVSIGGGGGSYDNTWNVLTSANIQSYAQGMVNFCHTIGLAGVDFDYEAFVSAEQEMLVGELIKAFKLLDPSLETSVCTNAGFPAWQSVMQNILDAAEIAPGNSAVDRVYIMSYYDPMQSEIDWIVGSDGNGGWTNWLVTTYGFTRARISVGIDDFDAHAYDPVVFRAWALSQGFSVAHWAFDPAHPQ